MPPRGPVPRRVGLLGGACGDWEIGGERRRRRVEREAAPPLPPGLGRVHHRDPTSGGRARAAGPWAARLRGLDVVLRAARGWWGPGSWLQGIRDQTTGSQPLVVGRVITASRCGRVTTASCERGVGSRGGSLPVAHLLEGIVVGDCSRDPSRFTALAGSHIAESSESSASTPSLRRQPIKHLVRAQGRRDGGCQQHQVLYQSRCSGAAKPTPLRRCLRILPHCHVGILVRCSE